MAKIIRSLITREGKQQDLVKIKYNPNESMERYAERFWDTNKDYLTTRVKEAEIREGTIIGKTPKEYWDSRIEMVKNNNPQYSNKEVLDKVLRGRDFKSQSEYYLEDFANDFRNSGDYQRWRTMLRDSHGRFVKMNLDDAEYQGRQLLFGVKYEVYKITNAAGTFYIFKPLNENSPKGDTSQSDRYKIYSEDIYKEMAQGGMDSLQIDETVKHHTPKGQKREPKPKPSPLDARFMRDFTELDEN